MTYFSVVPTATTQVRSVTLLLRARLLLTSPSQVALTQVRDASQPSVPARTFADLALLQIFAPEDGESNSDVLASYLIVQVSLITLTCPRAAVP